MATGCTNSPCFGKFCDNFRVQAPSGKIAAAIGAILLLGGLSLALAAHHVLPIGIGAAGVYAGLSGFSLGSLVTSAVAILSCKSIPSAPKHSTASMPVPDVDVDAIRAEAAAAVKEARRNADATFESPVQTVVEVADDGNCLFAAFNVAATVDDSTISDPSSVRKEAVGWIREVLINTAHPKHEELIGHLRTSMQDHFEAKAKQAMPAQLSDSVLGGLTASLQDAAKAQQAAASNIQVQQQAAVDLEEKARIAKEEEVISDLVAEYLEAMEQPGEFGGVVELFALSCKREVAVIVFAKCGAELIKLNGGISEKPPRRFQFDGKHYNPIVQPS